MSLECCFDFRGGVEGLFLAYMFIYPWKVPVHWIRITDIQMREIEPVIHDFFASYNAFGLSSILYARRYTRSDGISICGIIPSATVSVRDIRLFVAEHHAQFLEFGERLFCFVTRVVNGEF